MRRLIEKSPAFALGLCVLFGVVLGLVVGVVMLYALPAHAQDSQAALVETGKAAGMVLVKESILGAIAIIAIIIAAGTVVWTMRVTKTSNDDRVTDMKNAAVALEGSTDRWRKDLGGQAAAVEKLAGIVETQTLQITTAMRTNETNAATLARSLDDMARSMNTMLLELAKFMSRAGGLSGSYQAQRPRRSGGEPPKGDDE